MVRKVQNKNGAHYCRSLVQSQKSAHHLPMWAKTYSSSSELHGADEKGYLGFGVVDAWHDVAYGVLHVGVLYSTGSLAALVEPVGYQEWVPESSIAYPLYIAQESSELS